MNTIYIGDSGSGKTYQLKHRLLDIIDYTNKQIFLIGRQEEWVAFSDKVTRVEIDNIDKLIDIKNSIIIIDGLYDYFHSEELVKLAEKLFVTSRINNNDIYLGIISFQDNYRLLYNTNDLYAGYISPSNRHVLCNMFNMNYDMLPNNIKQHTFYKK